MWDGIWPEKPLTNYLEQYKPKSVEFYKDFDKFDRGFVVEF